MDRGGGEGYFPRGESTLRRVHGARVVGLVYGQRALLMQAANPLAFEGLLANTDGQSAPFQRLADTAKTMEKVFFGSREEANRQTARVRRLHARVRGSTERAAGNHPAGSSYAADDPEFLLWILACLADSAQAVYETFVRRLTGHERERFWADYLVVGELFGLPRSEAPADYAAYRAYMEERLTGPDLYVTREARELGRTVAFDLPLPWERRPALAVFNFMVRGLLPDRIRRLYGIAWTTGDQRAFEALARAHRAASRVTPRSIRRGPSASQYDLVATGERRRLKAPM